MRPPLVLRTVVVAALLSLALLAGAAQAAPRITALGAGPNANILFSFDAGAPGAVTAVPVTGLGSIQLKGIDRRPSNGLLYGFANNGNASILYTIDPISGAAKIVGGATVNVIAGASAFGIGFNPVSDRLRVVDDLASDGAGSSINNFRVNPNDGSVAGADDDLDFTGVPGGAPLVALAYDRSVAGATATTAFGLTSGGDRLVRLGGVDGTPSANSGLLFDIGPLGVDISPNSGLDIDPATGEAFAVLQVAGVSGLYRIDLATGAATLVGPIGNGAFTFNSLAVEPPPPPGPPPPPPVEPRLEALSLRPTKFAAANIGGAVLSRARKAPVGTTVAYRLSAATAVSFAVERKSVGRRVGKACKKQNRGNRDRKPCPRFKPMGGFPHTGSAGENSFKFTGRLRGRALKPGAYRLVARAGTSSQQAMFTILPPRP